jgi:hypothetical protein
MSFLENNLTSQRVKRAGGRAPSKNLAKAKDDDVLTRKGKLPSWTINENVDSAVTQNQHHTFHRGMGTREIEIELFLMEDDIEFGGLPDGGKISRVIRSASHELKSWYAGERVKGNVKNDDWTGFKSKIIEYCRGETVENLRKFKDEAWSEYIIRLRDWCMFRNVCEDDVFEKLQKESVPEKYIALFCMPNMNLQTLIEVVSKIEKADIKQKKFCKDGEQMKRRESSDVKKCFRCGRFGHLKINCRTKMYEEKQRELKCFLCGKIGHIKANCRENIRKKEINSTVEDECSTDRRSVKINEVDCYALFDSGASHSFIGYGCLQLFGIKSGIIKPCKKNF